MKGFLQSIPVVGGLFRDLQPDDVRAFWRFMQGHFDTSAVNKGDDVAMQLVAQALESLGIQNRDTFLKSYTTTIGRRVYTPFEIGVPQGGYDLWGQIVVCVHEHQHVVQHDREGLAYEVSYLTDRAARARWEAEAYRSNLEMCFWRYGQTPSAQSIAEGLFAYGCRAADVEVAAQSLALSAASVRRGAVTNESTRVAITWLNTNLPHLRWKGIV